jgi:hypothetical protein
VKDLHGTAAARADVPVDRCVALLADVERYPTWHPDVVREVEILERDERGRATEARTKLRAAIGGVGRDFDLTLAVSAQPDAVKLSRLAHGPEDREELEMLWEVHDGRIQLRLDAKLDVPRLLPTRGIGDAIANGFVEAAVSALQRRSGGAIR